MIAFPTLKNSMRKLSRRQLVMIGGDIKDEIEESVNCEATREAAMEWIDNQGGFRRNHETGNWEKPRRCILSTFQRAIAARSGVDQSG